MQNSTPALSTQIDSLEQDADIELWALDLTVLGGEQLYFSAELNEKGAPIVWQGKTYEPFPIQGDGFEVNGSGPANRPTLKVSNVFGVITGMGEDYDGLAGARVTRRKVRVRFLDAVNFYQGNVNADPAEEAVSHYNIEQLTALTGEDATFTLSIPTETDGAEFPSRVMLADVCSWGYRSDECGYVGPAVADEFDNPTTDPAQDKCGKCRRSCEMRGNIGSFGGFLSIGKLSQ